jgi:flagellar basal-body rod modification protein FlgD
LFKFFIFKHLQKTRGKEAPLAQRLQLVVGAALRIGNGLQDSDMEITSASEIQMDYMKLLIEQLKNQNPLEPLDSNDMASQLAQFSQLQQLEQANTNLSALNSSFENVLAATNRNYANSLIGKTVTFFAEDEQTGELTKMKGTVSSAFNDSNTGETLLGVTVSSGDEVQEYTLSLDAVVLVEN